jgi:hypothetical protein
MKIGGSCLCQGVRYEVSGPVGKAAYCHCTLCRKWSGSALVGYAAVPKPYFRWTSGEELLGRFQSSERVLRVFCTRCGSALAASPTNPAIESEWVMMGTLDGDPGVRPEHHIFTASKAPWFEMTDDLPWHPEHSVRA